MKLNSQQLGMTWTLEKVCGLSEFSIRVFFYSRYIIFHCNFPASRYDLRFATNIDILADDSTWNEADIIDSNHILEGSLTPQEAGIKMEILVDSSIFNSVDTLTYFLAIKAYDDTNQLSKVSNIAPFKLDLAPSPVTDLYAVLSETEDNVKLTFTATGGDLSYGIGT